MKPVMASLKERFGASVTYRYHEFNQPETAQINRDFDIQAHPMIFILDRRGNLVRKFPGVVPMEELVATLQPLVKQ